MQSRCLNGFGLPFETADLRLSLTVDHVFFRRRSWLTGGETKMRLLVLMDDFYSYDLVEEDSCLGAHFFLMCGWA